ncbi:N-acetyltransferase family protein [Kiloniella sp.]|uniref:GNAT family N-acetyltransferase n=1 Tax=Kiloniella sp. TaxID=1938587 RepID=UPI003B0222F7
MIIRAAQEKDYLSAVLLYAEFGASVPVISGGEGKRQWRKLLEHPGTEVVVAVEKSAEGKEEQVCAIVTLHLLPNMTYLGRPYALIENVITAENCRGQGLGRKVMEHTIEIAWGANAYKIMLLTGKGRQDGGAKGFYESLGFSDDDKYGMTLRKVPTRK